MQGSVYFIQRQNAGCWESIIVTKPGIHSIACLQSLTRYVSNITANDNVTTPGHTDNLRSYHLAPLMGYTTHSSLAAWLKARHQGLASEASVMFFPWYF